jgi:hypothetical protein
MLFLLSSYLAAAPPAITVHSFPLSYSSIYSICVAGIQPAYASWRENCLI